MIIQFLDPNFILADTFVDHIDGMAQLVWFTKFNITCIIFRILEVL